MAGNGDKRKAIMQAAEELFTSRRFHQITMDDIAAVAAVAKGTLYRYFRDKEDLFFQTATSGFDELCGLIDRTAPAAEGSFMEQIVSACRRVSSFFERRHQLLRLMQSEEGRMAYCDGGLRGRWMRKRRGLVSAIAGILSRGIRLGQLRHDLPAEVLANYLLGMLRTRQHWLTDGSPAVRQHEAVVDLFLRGAGAGAAGAKRRRGR